MTYYFGLIAGFVNRVNIALLLLFVNMGLIEKTNHFGLNTTVTLSFPLV